MVVVLDFLRTPSMYISSDASSMLPLNDAQGQQAAIISQAVYGLSSITANCAQILVLSDGGHRAVGMSDAFGCSMLIVYMTEIQPRYSAHSSSLSSAGVLSDFADARH